MKNRENLRVRKVLTKVKGLTIEYDEYYLVDGNGEEIFDREIELENDARLFDIFKKEKNLLTISEIKDIRKKYNLNQKEYAKAIGVGEITIHRFENGSIQTEAVDSIMRLSTDPDNMAFLILQNKDNLPKELYSKLQTRIKELQMLKRHRLIDMSRIDLKSKFEETNAEIVADNIIKIYNDVIDDAANNYHVVPEYITPLKLQKLLYYVQGMCLCLYGKCAFKDEIKAWQYGPVVESIYKKYKSNRSNEIKTPTKIEKISDSLHDIIVEVVRTYGTYEANRLIDLTHEEDPWKYTNQSDTIVADKIKEYFDKVYDI